jgi:short-subunit dehydrogenase
MYNAAKFALEGFTEALRVEVMQCGIDVIAVCPSVTGTDFFEHPYVKDSALREQSRSVKPMTPEAVSRALIRASKKRKRDVHLTLPGWLAVRLNPWIPGIMDFVAYRMRGKIVSERYRSIQEGK